MAELTLRDPLAANEIIEILLQEIEKRLRADCTLMGDLTYSGFKATFTLNLAYERSLTKPTTVWGTASTPASPESGPTIDAGAAAISGEYVAGAPNVERQSHDLPIPVLVQTPAGTERRRVKIERAGKK